MFRWGLGAAVLAATPVLAQDAGPAALVDRCGGVRASVVLSGSLTVEDAQAAADILTARLPGFRLFGQNMVAEVEVVSADRLTLHRAGAESFDLSLDALFSQGETLAAYDVISTTSDTADLDGQVWFEIADEPGVYMIVEPEPVIAVFGVTDAQMQYDQTNRPAVSLQLTPETGAAFCAATAERIGAPIGLVIADQIVTAPTVMSSICGGSIIVTGSFMRQEAVELAFALSAPGFPYEAQVTTQTIVEGRDAAAPECAALTALGD